ncbi:MAG: hypothetical protein IT365_15540, partial [Candidatus Hydrogenedentes bacterium]|nr:hypothetical protein [Candidatus Hydrogenedentota bacterium]
HVYSWVMNNYWFTNFRASQEGEFKWSYYITSTNDISNTQAARSGWNSRTPMIPRVLPSGNASESEATLSTLDLGLPNVLLVGARPASHRDGIVLQLREVDGKAITVDVAQILSHAKIRTMREVDVLENDLGESLSALSFSPFESKFIRIEAKAK